MTTLGFPIAGRSYVPVTWKKADAMQSLFRRHGVVTTIELDTQNRTARLDVIGGWSDLTDAALQEWDATDG
jgi:hypothetical protein